MNLQAWLELSKPRIMAMVLVTTAVGYWLAGARPGSRLGWTLLATALSAAASGSLNQLAEREQDALMRRTRSRPLPQGRVSPREALAFGLFCAVSGVGLLAWKVNWLSAGLAAFTIASYVLVYTPMKRLTPQSTWVGAVSGAIPPLLGWAAARGTIDSQAWSLFAVQFLWQIPHFLSIFWIYREDYAAAGFRVMPVVDPGGSATARQIAVHSFALLPASLMPTLSGMTGLSYAWAALPLGAAFMVLGMRASWTMSLSDTRRLFFASLAYLPLLLVLLAFSVPSQANDRALSRASAASRSRWDAAPAFQRVPDFELREARGRSIRRSDLKGPWLAGFVFARCAVQCPMLTERMKALRRRLPGVQLVSFSVDPADTPEVLSRYAESRGADWLFLTGRRDQVRTLVREGFKLPLADGGGALEPIIHSKKLVLVDGKGFVRGYFDADDKASFHALQRQALGLLQDSD